MTFNDIPGGVTAPQGFLAGSAYCGVKATNKDSADMALIVSQHKTVAAATFTTNNPSVAQRGHIERSLADTSIVGFADFGIEAGLRAGTPNPRCC